MAARQRSGKGQGGGRTGTPPLDPRTLARLREAGLLNSRALARAGRGTGRGDGRQAGGQAEGRGGEAAVRSAPGRANPRAGKGGAVRPAAGGASRAPAGPGRGAASSPGPAGRRTVFEAPGLYGPQRLQKVLAHAGVASRRASEQLILAGRVKVNGQVVTTLGTKVVPGVDQIEVDGKPIGARENLAYCLLYKPRKVVTTVYDPQGRTTVLDLIPDAPVRLFPVGRLDYDTEGLLLLTNDGDLAHRLMHPARQVWKTYVARVRGVPSAAKLRRLEQGIVLEDGPTAPCRTRLLKVVTDRQNPRNQVAWVEISLHEGRNRQVRRMFAAIGHEVVGLTRTRLGPLRLEGLQPGQYRYLTPREIQALRQHVGLRPQPPYPLAQMPQGVRGEPQVRPSGRPAVARPQGTVRRFRSRTRLGLRQA